MTSGSPDVHALSGAYAMDALTPEESLAFAGHLESCASCRDEVRSLREAAASLAAQAAEPAPDRLRASVLAGITSVRPLPPVGDAAAADEPEEDDEVDELAAARERRTRRSARAWVAVAAALALVAGGAVVRSVQLDSQLDSVTAQAAQVTAVLTAPDAVTTSASVSTGGRAAVVTSASLGQSVLVTDSVAPPPPGSTYQVWYLAKSGAPASAGFVPAGGTTSVLLQGDPTTASGVGITVEPAGGSPQPTTTPVMAVTL